MSAIIPHPREPERLQALGDLGVLTTPIEERFERLSRLGQRCLNAPICAISCLDHRRQWFKSVQGLNIEQTQRCVSFCQHTILQDGVMVIPDARLDPNFAHNPLVRGEPGLVFYAGAPIYAGDGLPVAAMCVVDYEPRGFDKQDCNTLLDLARLAQDQLLTPSSRIVEQELIKQIGESWRIALVDPLTRLWNNEGMLTIVSESIRYGYRAGEHCALALIDIPAFMRINQTLGFVQSDSILRALAQELLRHLKDTDSIGRIRGDEFVVMMNGVRDRQDATDRLERLRSAAHRFTIEGITDRPTLGGYGIAIMVPAGTACTPVRLFDQLADAMYQHKILPGKDADVRLYQTGETIINAHAA